MIDGQKNASVLKKYKSVIYITLLTHLCLTIIQ